MRTIKPLNDRLLLRRTEKETTTPGGLIIPDNAKVPSFWGEILAVGPGRHLKNSADRRPIDPSLKPGVVVRFRGVHGLDIDLDNEVGLVMIREDEVEAIRVED